MTDDRRPDEAGEPLHRARILIIDDEAANVRLLERLLAHEGCAGAVSLTDPREALALFEVYQPDLVLLDLHMPHRDGLEVLADLRGATPPGSFVPILVLTADVTSRAKTAALSGGASDFLVKPLDTAEVLLRIRNLLRMRQMHSELSRENERLDAGVRARTHELEEAQHEILARLARAAEYRDDFTGDHTQRVGDLAARIAGALHLPPDEVEIIRRAAPLHDVGKIGIPDSILTKPSVLTLEERMVMQRHTVIGADILGGSRFAPLQRAAEIALTHHLRWDGTGYPTGAAGEEIPVSGRIVAVADVFDALIHERPYKAAWPVPAALAEVRDQRGRQFDPHVVDAFLALADAPGFPA
ncbi:MAG: Two-component system response regulator [Gemmatimonadetes bacterium]|nr:Two-component system response regulator [Gemmatimonadota bacterium]